LKEHFAVTSDSDETKLEFEVSEVALEGDIMNSIQYFKSFKSGGYVFFPSSVRAFGHAGRRIVISARRTT
jgi:hypothetical protein